MILKNLQVMSSTTTQLDKYVTTDFKVCTTSTYCEYDMFETVLEEGERNAMVFDYGR